MEDDKLSALISTLPTILALRLRELQHPEGAFEALWAMCDLLEAALRLLVMAGLAEHPTLPEKLQAEIHKSLQRPSLGDWLQIAIAVSNHQPEQSNLRRLKETVEALRKLWRVDGFKDLRNSMAHSGFNRPVQSKPSYEQWRPRILAFAEKHLEWLSEASLLLCDAEGRLILMRGTSEAEQAMSSWPLLEQAHFSSVWLVVAGQALHLGPLAIADAEGSDPLIFMSADKDRGRVKYLRVGNRHPPFVDSSPAIFADFQRRFLSGSSTEWVEAGIRREAGRRVGREREFQDLLAAVRQPGPRALWVGGAAGSGKSCLMAGVMEDLYDNPLPDTCFIPYRFRAGHQECNRTLFVSILTQALESSPYSPQAGSEGKQSGGVNVSPVQKLEALVKTLQSGVRVLLVLDGLDEVVELDPRFLVEVLQPLSRAGVRLVGAGRSERGLPEFFSTLDAEQPFPRGLPAMSEDDIRQMLVNAISLSKDLRRRLFKQDSVASGVMENAFIQEVSRCSEGLPLYITYLKEDLWNGSIGPDNPSQLPRKLSGYHDELIRRAGIVGDLQAIVTPIVVLLALAAEPLSINAMEALLLRREFLDEPDRALVERALVILAGMLKCRENLEGEAGFTLFHHSLRLHILNHADFQQTVKKLRKSLAMEALKPWGDALEVYLLRNGVRHLVDVGQRDGALHLTTDLDFLLKRFRRLELTGRAAEGWYADWELLLPGSPLSGSLDAWWNFARGVKHCFRHRWLPDWRVLFQLAMDHADDSPVTLAAEQYVKDGYCDWAWIRLVNRPAQYAPNPLLAVLVGHADTVDGAKVLKDGRILSWSSDHTLRLWDGQTGEILAVLEGHTEGVTGAKFLDDGRILSWSHDSSLRIWDGRTGAEVGLLDAHTATVNGVEVLKDGRILSWSSDHTLRLWDGQTGAVLTLPAENVSLS